MPEVPPFPSDSPPSAAWSIWDPRKLSTVPPSARRVTHPSSGARPQRGTAKESNSSVLCNISPMATDIGKVDPVGPYAASYVSVA